MKSPSSRPSKRAPARAAQSRAAASGPPQPRGRRERPAAGQADAGGRSGTGRSPEPGKRPDTARRSDTVKRADTVKRPDTARRPESGRAAAAGKPVPDRPYVPAIARIEQVRSVLGEILQWQYPADQVLSRWMRAHPKLGLRDRAEVTEAVFNVLRHLRRYRNLAESGSGPAARRLAILGLDAIMPAEMLRAGLEGDEPAWLERIHRVDPRALPRAVRESLPDWLDERFGALSDSDSLIAALNQPAPLDIRVNPLKTTREAVLADFAAGPAARHAPQATPYSPWGIRFQGRPAVMRWPAYEKGEIEVQDEGSQILVSLMAPRRGEMIIDFCAGAGGKTLLLGALMRSTGRLYAFDVSQARLARAKPRFARSGLSNIVPVVIQPSTDQRVKRLRGKAQRVLVDAPCTGLGTLRRNPDLKWRQHPDAVGEYVALQKRILAEASACVAPGGRLVYATCSLLPEENELQVEAFLQAHPEFERLDAAAIAAERCPGIHEDGPYLQLRPDRHGTDGFFAAVMQRRKAA